MIAGKLRFYPMSEEQLSALLSKIKQDKTLQERLKGAADIDAALSIAKEAGFDVSKADWLRRQAQKSLELSDEELEAVSGGSAKIQHTAGCACTQYKQANTMPCGGC